MISDGQTPYDQLNVSPDADQGEIRNSYLQLRKEGDDDTQTRLKTAWELVWSPEQRATIDAFLFQADEPEANADSIAATVENDKAVLEWSDFLDEESLVQDEVIALKEAFLRTTWLNLPFQHYFQRSIPTLQQPPVPAPTLTPLTYSDVDPQKPFSVPSEGKTAAAAPSPKGSRNPGDWIGDRLYTAANPLRALGKAIRLALTTPDKPSGTYSATSTKPARVDLTMLYLLVAVVLLFIVLSVSGYFIVRFLFLSDTSPLQGVAEVFIGRFAEPTAEVLNSSPLAPPTLVPDLPAGGVFGPQPADATPQATTLPEAPQGTGPPAGEEEAAPPPEPTPTATVAPVAIETNTIVNLRSGPGEAYEILDVIPFEASLQAVGRTAPGDWLQVVTVDGQSGWLSAPLVTATGDVNTLPEVAPPPLP